MQSVPLYLAVQVAIVCLAIAVVAAAIAFATRKEIRGFEKKAGERSRALKAAREKFAELKQSFDALNNEHLDTRMELAQATRKVEYIDQVIGKFGADDNTIAAKTARTVLYALKEGMDKNEAPDKLTRKIISATFDLTAPQPAKPVKQNSTLGSVAVLTR